MFSPKQCFPFVALDSCATQAPAGSDFRYNWLLWVRKAITSQNMLSIRQTEFLHNGSVTIKQRNKLTKPTKQTNHAHNKREGAIEPTPSTSCNGFGPLISPRSLPPGISPRAGAIPCLHLEIPGLCSAVLPLALEVSPAQAAPAFVFRR